MLAGCSPRLTNNAPSKPDWLTAKPYSPDYYTGIGHSNKTGDNNYIQEAKKSALQDLVSEIKVNVSSTSILHQLDVNNVYSEQYEETIQTDAADEIQDFEVVDSWQDETNYWVYYRLSKARYKEIKDEEKRVATVQGTDYYQKAKQAEQAGQRVQALTFYFQTLRSMEKYLADAIVVTVDNKDILIVNETYAAIQDILGKINLQVNPKQVQINRRLSDDALSLVASASFNDTHKPASGLPLAAGFDKGAGLVHRDYITDSKGNSRILVTKIASKDLEQSLKVSVNVDTLSGAKPGSVLRLIAQSMKTPSAQVLLEVQRPVIFITSAEENFGRRKENQQLTDQLVNMLTSNGFEVTKDQSKADLLFDVSADTEKGSVSGSIYITYLTGKIQVTSAKEAKDIYSTSFDRIRGYGLDYDKSSTDAYAKASESLEKERFKQLLDSILQ